MIKDVVVPLEAIPADDLRLAAAETIAAQFAGRVIGLFFNIIPLLSVPIDVDSGPGMTIKLLRDVRAAGDVKSTALKARMAKLIVPFEFRRFDVFPEDVANFAVRAARVCDSFVSLRPDTTAASEDLIEALLFGCGHHLFLVPKDYLMTQPVKHAAIAWNGSREAARAVAESMPILAAAENVTVLVIDEADPIEEATLVGPDMTMHLRHHGIRASLHRVARRESGTAATLMAEVQRLNADVIVMGGYGHSRTREWLLGGVTRELLYRAPVPIIIAH
jgi:nucleotide-binding universal stress UspA family protein